VLYVLHEGITATRKHLGGDPRMRLEDFLADFVSTLVNDNGRGDIVTICLVPYIPPAPIPDQSLEVWKNAASPTSGGRPT